MPVSFIGQRREGGEERKTIIFQISPGMASIRKGYVNLFNRGAGLLRRSLCVIIITNAMKNKG